MSDTAIRVEGLSKEYRIGAKENGYETLRDALTDALMLPFRRAGRVLRGRAMGAVQLNEMIWALKDVSFEINRGEVVGLVGRNGAGKSTLLKILARITEPTAGFADVYGRVGSLLEVGIGFNPELTGRENIYMSGAILGMKMAEINCKFDEIVAFAEIEKFIYTPVKRYSTGMFLRLAFAVAAHLEPEILLVDEVLAVGDASFQKKCLGKMGEVAKGGRTVLFVSHNMVAVQSLCTKGVLLQEGMVNFQGSTEQTIRKYLESVEQLHTQPLEEREDRVGGEMFRFTNVQFLNPQTTAPWNHLASGRPVIIRIGYVCTSNHVIEDVGIGIAFYTMSGTHLFGCRNRAVGVTVTVHPGNGYTDCLISKWPLKGGRYSYHLFAEKRATALDYVTDAGSFDVESGDYYGSGCLPAPGVPGVLIGYTWEE